MRLIFLLLALTYSMNGYADPLYFAMDPSLSPDGSKIVFSYNSDLWIVPTTGGLASQITGLDGIENRPVFSPDGKWIAFSSTQYGNRDVFIVPVEGGAVTQLTFHTGYDDVDSWSWDNKSIYFTSNRENRMAGYSVGIEGGTPVRLFDHYFNTVHNVVPHPSSGEIFFNESWESKNFAHRKRYKGEYNPDIKSYNLKTKEYKEYTDYNGKDFGATIDKNGKVYFMSDENKGEFNLYTFDQGKKKALTSFTTSVYWPKVSANGSKIVFRKDYQIHVYDVASGKTTTPDIRVYQNSILEKSDDFKVDGNISNFSISADKKKMAFVSRGRMFVSDVEGKFIKEMETLSTEAVGEVHWLKDNKTLLFTQSNNGYYNWHTLAADGTGIIQKWTADVQNNRLLTFNSDHTMGVYLSGRNEIRTIDLATKESTTIHEDELWGFYNSAPTFSPDDRYILYSAYRNFEQDIFVYDLEEKKSINLTNTLVTEIAPAWSPDGKYIYFTSNLTQPSYPYGPRDHKVYQMALDKYEDDFKLKMYDKLFEEKEDKDKKEKEPKKEDDEKEENKEVEGADSTKNEKIVSLELEGMMDRLRRISPGFGNQTSPYIIKNGNKTIVLYLSNHDEGNTTLWKTTLEDFEKPKTEKIGKQNFSSYQIADVDGKYWLWTRGNIHTLNPDAGKLEKIEINHSFSKNRKDEFKQMYFETWAGMEQNFYDENFHDQNWEKRRDQYAAYLPYVSTRSDLRMILNDLLGELNTSHFGFYSFGSEENTFLGYQTHSSGILWSKENPYQVERILKDGPADYKDKNIQAGDILTAVDGEKVDEKMNRSSYFTFPHRKEEMVLTFTRNGEVHDVLIRPLPAFSVSTLLYDEWQDNNQAYVDQKSDKRIAYVHMKNMGQGELAKFKQDIVREAQYRDGLILDLRYNTGGNVHDEVLQWLSRKEYLKWKYREGEKAPQPNFTPSSKPIVLLINEQSLSDAEMTAAGFKELGLGTIVGTETYRWIIFTSGAGLVDGFYRLPSWGCYTLDGKNLEKSGVSPDIRVEKDFNDRLVGTYPQLNKAIELIMEKL